MTDLDKSGSGYQRVRTYLGPTLGWVDEMVSPMTEITVGGTYVVKPGDSLILVEVAAAVTIQLPDVILWWQQTASQPATGFERSITVKDIGGNAANFNIVIAPFGQQAIDNIQQSLVLSVARSNVKIIPLVDLSGWAIEASSIGGASGGGGDVFKAGNNTFTGSNTFNGPVTVQTVATSDNDQTAASTAWVKNQNYLISASLSGYAPLNSPIFIGDPQAPTPALGDNDTSIATTEFVKAVLASIPGGAPVGAEYITSSINGTLTAERVLTNTASITWDFSTPGQAKANSAAGGGNVSNSGTPVNGQLAQWINSTTIQGIDIGNLGLAPIASPVFTGDPKAPTPATADNDTSIATTAYVKTNMAGLQPLDGDLTALSALGGTNTIYYRSAVDTWSPVTYSGLTFSGGVLTVAVGGGNVSNTGTPTLGQYAKWTAATTIQGVAPATVLSDIGAQPLDNELTALAGTTAAADVVPYYTGGATAGTTTFGVSARSLLAISSSVVADRLPYFVSTTAAALTTFTAFARTFLDDVDAAAVRATIGAQAAGSYQPLDGDLTALAALTGTNTIYYRSAADVWSPVTFSGLTFSGGVLTAAGGGSGNVISSGTPLANQLAQWTDATHIQGITASSALSAIGAVAKAGDTMTGDLVIAKTAPGLYINKPAAGTNATISGLTNGFTRWVMSLGDSTAEGGGNAGSDFAINRYSDAGGLLGTPFFIQRSNGNVSITNANLTGIPVAPTAPPGTISTQLATTAFAAALMAPGITRVVSRLVTGTTSLSPTSGMKYAIVFCVGAGAGGGGVDGTASDYWAAGGGGGGATAIAVVSAAGWGPAQTVTIGNNGLGGGPGGDGSNGGQTSFGALCMAVGGSGFGTSSASRTGGQGGDAAACIGDIRIAGQGGGGGFISVGDTNHGSRSGAGGGSMFGGGAPAAASTGVTALGYGGAGSGAVGTAADVNGGNGYQGCCFILEFI